MPRVIVTHRVRDVARWFEVSGEFTPDLVGAEAAGRFVCVDDPSKTGVVLDYPAGADVRLLATAIGALPGMDEFMDRLGVIRGTVSIYTESSPE